MGKIKDTFESNAHKYHEFYVNNGRKPSTGACDKEEVRLASWANSASSSICYNHGDVEYKKKVISEVCPEVLEGRLQKSYGDNWEDIFLEFKNFVRTKGYPSCEGESAEERKLNGWITNQRCRYKSGRLEKERYDKIEAFIPGIFENKNISDLIRKARLEMFIDQSAENNLMNSGATVLELNRLVDCGVYDYESLLEMLRGAFRKDDLSYTDIQYIFQNPDRYNLKWLFNPEFEYNFLSYFDKTANRETIKLLSLMYPNKIYLYGHDSHNLSNLCSRAEIALSKIRNENYRICVELCIYGGLNLRQISLHKDVSRETIRNNINGGLKELRKLHNMRYILLGTEEVIVENPVDSIEDDETPIEESGLSPICYNKLLKNEIDTVGKLVEKYRFDGGYSISQFKGVGDRVFNEITDFIENIHKFKPMKITKSIQNIQVSSREVEKANNEIQSTLTKYSVKVQT